MEIRFRCPECGTPVELESASAATGPAACGSCERPLSLQVTDGLRTRNVVDLCPVCGCRHLYVQKDFNQRLGLGIVVLAGAVGLVFVALDRPVGFYLALLSAVILDAFLYLILPRVTICYACRAEFRGFSPHPDNGPFDLKIADVYDRKRMDAAEKN